MAESLHSLSHIIGELHLVCEREVIYLFIPKNAQYDSAYAPAGIRKKHILGSWHLACCKLTPTSAS